MILNEVIYQFDTFSSSSSVALVISYRSPKSRSSLCFVHVQWCCPLSVALNYFQHIWLTILNVFSEQTFTWSYGTFFTWPVLITFIKKYIFSVFSFFFDWFLYCACLNMLFSLSVEKYSNRFINFNTRLILSTIQLPPSSTSCTHNYGIGKTSL